MYTFFSSIVRIDVFNDDNESNKNSSIFLDDQIIHKFYLPKHGIFDVTYCPKFALSSRAIIIM